MRGVRGGGEGALETICILAECLEITKTRRK